MYGNLFTILSLRIFELELTSRPVEKGEVGVSYPGPRDVWGSRRRSQIQSTPKSAI